jgi:hypothetical protein
VTNAPPPAPFVYTYAKATGRKPDNTTTLVQWREPSPDKGALFCIDPKGEFLLRREQFTRDGVLDCEASRFESRNFRERDTNGIVNYTLNYE